MNGQRVAIMAGVTLGALGAGVLISRGDLAAAAFAGGGALLLRYIVGRVPDRSGAPWLVPIIALAYGGRIVLLAALHEVLVHTGRGGHLFGDDATYEWLAVTMIEYFRGETTTLSWFGNAYLMGAYVYLESAVFALFGPQVTIVKVLNSLFGVLLVVVMYDLVRRLFSARAGVVAAALCAFFPSLVLWSVLNLKDSMALLLMIIVIWAITRVALGERSWWLLVIAFASLAILDSVRRYLFQILIVLVPIAVMVSRAHLGRPRILRGAACAVFGLVLWVASANGYLGPAYFTDPLVRYAFIEAGLVPASARLPVSPVSVETIERQRAYAALGARTGFAEPVRSEQAPLAAREGERFTVRDASVPAPSCGPSPRVIVVPMGTLLALGGKDQPGVVGVRPCDTVIVGDVTNSDPFAKPLSLHTGSGNEVEVVPSGTTASATMAIVRLASHVPTGVAYVIAAPFPWAATTALERMTMPDILLWYVVLVAAAAQLWISRRCVRDLFLLGSMFAGVFAVLVLVEGNVGTLFRHRAMLIPLASAFAAPALLRAFAGYRSRGVIRARPQSQTVRVDLPEA